MYNLYLAENPKQKASLSFYAKTLHGMKLKFHKPKKDLCGICETYYKGDEVEKTKLREEYLGHTHEKMLWGN